MTEQLKVLFNGQWFLPMSEKNYPGTVIEDAVSGRLILEIFSTEYLNGVPIVSGNETLDDSGSPIDHYDLILGYTNIENFTTLFNCTLIGKKSIGDSLVQLRYEVEFIFDGVHFTNKGNLKLKSVTVEFPFVGTWYDGWITMEKLKNRKLSESVADQIIIDDNLSLIFHDIVDDNSWKIGPSYEVKYSKWVEFSYALEVPFDESIKDWFKLSRLLEFTTRKKVPFRIVSVEVSRVSVNKVAERFSETDSLSLRVVNHSLHEGEDTDKHWIHQNFMLFSKWKMEKTELNTIVKTWFSNTHLYPIYDYYLDSHNWFSGTRAKLTNVMFNNRFLNLIQGLESYHFELNERYALNNQVFIKKRQEVLNLINDGELRKWAKSMLKFPRKFSLSERLDSLIKRNEKVIINIFGSVKPLNSFSEHAKDYRDVLSHGRLEETDLGIEIHSYFHAAQVLLCLCILESLKISEETVIKLVKSNHHLNKSYREIFFAQVSQSIKSKKEIRSKLES